MKYFLYQRKCCDIQTILHSAKQILPPPLLPRPPESVINASLRAPKMLRSTISLPIAPNVDRQHTQATLSSPSDRRIDPDGGLESMEQCPGHSFPRRLFIIVIIIIISVRTEGSSESR